MLTILTVLKSGGIYTPDWVARLKRGVERHLMIKHEFICLSDVEVPCARVPLIHDWPAWWSKLEMFRPKGIKGPTLYLDLDTMIVGNIDWIEKIPYEFAMLRNFHRSDMMGSGVMWFGQSAPTIVYDKFRADPKGWIRYYNQRRAGPFVGDQAFISDTIDIIQRLQDAAPKGAIVSYKKHCVNGMPPGAAIVCMHGTPKQHELVESTPWVAQAWA